MGDGSETAEGRRGGRDWLVDVLLFGLAVVFWMFVAEDMARWPEPPPQWLWELDRLLGAVGCLVLWLRRRWPVQSALVLVALSSVAGTVAAATLIALFTVAVHRRPRTAAPVFAASAAAAVVYVFARPDPALSHLAALVSSLALESAAVGWGLFVRYRRQLRERAARQERMEAERARNRARDDIARELHDVLGHRLSLLSLHAGALEFRPTAPPEELAKAAEVIREHSHLAMQDLREVIGVLRAPVGEMPRPTLAELDSLVEECRPAMRVDLVRNVDEEVPERLGRTAYRIVQESLTNARKHAPGAAVAVRVEGERGAELEVEVSNGAPEQDPEPRHSPGHGLIGLSERARLAGGRLEYGPSAGGGWRVRASLPWPP